VSRTILPDPRRFPRFAGVPTFCRYPLLDLVPAESLPVDWVLYGVPFDGGVTYRPGARFGPRAIRDASQYVKRYSIEHGIDLCDTLSLADGGDAPVSPYDCRENAERVIEHAAALADPSSTKLFAVGGDHSVAYANLKATWIRRSSTSTATSTRSTACGVSGGVMHRRSSAPSRRDWSIPPA
jgi:agmatinase